MGSLKAVSVPERARGLRVRPNPELLIWMEGGDDDEVIALIRSLLTSLACVPYDVPNTAELLQPGQVWQVRRYVRVTLLGRETIVAEIFPEDSDEGPSEWWEQVLIRRLAAKYPTSAIQAA